MKLHIVLKIINFKHNFIHTIPKLFQKTIESKMDWFIINVCMKHWMYFLPFQLGY